MALQTYDCKNWIISVGGVPISGYAEDEIFTIEWDSDWWTDKNGADGIDTTRSANNDWRATVTLKLMQSSESLVVLNALLVGDGYNAGLPKSSNTTVPLTITSLLPNGAKYLGEHCYIKKPPTSTGGKEASAREYAIRVPQLIPVILAAGDI